MKILDVKDLSGKGFTLTPHGWEKVIPGTFRFTYSLFIFKDDGGAGIFGTVTGKMGADEVLEYEDFLTRMAHRAPDAAQGARNLVAGLIAEGLVVVEE